MRLHNQPVNTDYIIIFRKIKLVRKQNQNLQNLYVKNVGDHDGVNLF